MLKSKKRLSLFICILVLGIGLGLFSSNENFPSVNQSTGQTEAFIVFSVSLGFMLLILIVERIAVSIEQVLMRIVVRRQSFRSTFAEMGNPFFFYMGWLFLALGIGLGFSALWLESNRFWTGFTCFAGGTGLLLGWTVSKWISSKFYER